MAQSKTENARRANARTAGAAALLVAAVMIGQGIVQAIVGVFGNLAYASDPDGIGFQQPLDTFGPVSDLAVAFGTSVLPIAIGVFLAFWLLVPLSANLRIAGVLQRALAASAVASAVSLVFSAVFSVGSVLASAGPLFGNAFPRPDGSLLFDSLFSAVQSVLYTFVAVTPVVLLAGVVVWLWAAKDRPVASAA